MKPSSPSYAADFSTGDQAMNYRLSGKSLFYRAGLWVVLALAILVLVRLAPNLTRVDFIPSDDFVRFWASARLNLQHMNPYDAQLTEQQQMIAGDVAPGSSSDSIMLNPPWAISLILPFGLLDYPTSRMAWLIVSTILILVSAILLWRVYQGEEKLRWLALVAVFAFGPTISLLEKGQISGIMLLGLVGFLYFATRRRNDWLAGVSLALVSIKPQMMFLFWLAVLLWVIQQRRWLVVLSTALTIGALSLVAMLFNPHLLTQYISMLRTYQLSNWAVPTLGTYLRYFIFGLDQFWVQFVPVLLGAIWLVCYWYQHRKTWNWADELPIILFISMIISPYSWTYDLVVLIPAVILAVIWITRDWKHPATILFIISYLGIGILDTLLHTRLDEFWFIWVAPAIFAWYLLVKWQYAKYRNIEALVGAG